MKLRPHRQTAKPAEARRADVIDAVVYGHGLRRPLRRLRARCRLERTMIMGHFSSRGAGLPAPVSQNRARGSHTRLFGNTVIARTQPGSTVNGIAASTHENVRSSRAVFANDAWTRLTHVFSTLTNPLAVNHLFGIARSTGAVWLSFHIEARPL